MIKVPQQSYFENELVYTYETFVNPDAKITHSEWEEISKDVVTSNLNGSEIISARYGSSIISYCDMLPDNLLKDTKQQFMRELLFSFASSKGRNGFTIKRLTEKIQKVISHESKGKKEIGD